MDEQTPRTTARRWRAGRPVAESADPPDWFADEIAIDFPSVDAAVERIRDGFLAADEPAGAMCAEIALSAREAFHGAIVPLEIPVRRMCESCGGRGETWTEACRRCGGSGAALINHQVRVSMPARVADGARFRFSVTTPFAPPTRIELRVAIR